MDSLHQWKKLSSFVYTSVCLREVDQGKHVVTDVIIYMQIITRISSNEMTLWKRTKVTLMHTKKTRTLGGEFLINAIKGLWGRSVGWWICCCIRLKNWTCVSKKDFFLQSTRTLGKGCVAWSLRTFMISFQCIFYTFFFSLLILIM